MVVDTCSMRRSVDARCEMLVVNCIVAWQGEAAVFGGLGFVAMVVRMRIIIVCWPRGWWETGHSEGGSHGRQQEKCQGSHNI